MTSWGQVVGSNDVHRPSSPRKLLIPRYAGVAKLADARDLKSRVAKATCGFDSRPRHSPRDARHRAEGGAQAHRNGAGTVASGHDPSPIFVRAAQHRAEGEPQALRDDAAHVASGQDPSPTLASRAYLLRHPRTIRCVRARVPGRSAPASHRAYRGCSR